ncbi:hypothetical protein RJT34_20092 [Clitoria ternatea]|uniref:Uncharacterized protein n=1 Tax=Clitoria ternatea TaxID=43366 RepID=A0AAN9ISR0_CLITE
MGSQGNGQQQSHLQHSSLSRKGSWYSLTLNEVNSELGDLGKPLGSMNLDELLQNVWTAEASKSVVIGMDSENNVAQSTARIEELLLEDQNVSDPDQNGDVNTTLNSNSCRMPNRLPLAPPGSSSYKY